MTAAPGLLDTLCQAGASTPDTDAEQHKKALLLAATALASLVSLVWYGLYWLLGVRFSALLPVVFNLLLAVNLLGYLKGGNLVLFRNVQLGFFLVMPFAAQWGMGSFVAASGLCLWGVLAPVGAIMLVGVGQSVAWFAAYLALILISGVVDYALAGHAHAVPAEVSGLFFTLNLTAVSALVFLLLRFASVERERTQQRLEDAHRLLQAEQDRSERLLLNVLPGPIAERLKRGNQTIADGFADVSVMFADIVNFTHVAEGLSPQQVFSMLNRIFSTFDELAQQYGLEKIKTIGDAYMAAGGLDEGNSLAEGLRPDYTAAIADLALAMRDLLHRDFDVNRRHLDVRIGIGTGPVVAGVVGKNKFIYDLWGDTVNTASRITGEGQPGMIQVDEATYQRLRDRFDFTPPLTLPLKGKGDTVIYRLLGRQAARPEDNGSAEPAPQRA